jgi:dTDP-4-dehydrorhamnose 3,5-epimerase
MSIIEGLKIIDPTVFKDQRGFFICTYRKDNDDFKVKDGKQIEFQEDDVSFSTKNVLRGLHGDRKTWKLVYNLIGEVFLAVVDMRKDSATYLNFQTFILGENKQNQILIPPGCVNGHLCLSEQSIFCYKQSEIYEGSQNQLSVAWNDPKLKIPWPVKNPILSERDRTVPFI